MTQIMSVSVAAATAVVENDLLQNETEFSKKENPRMITAISLTGSAAAGDCKINLVVGGKIAAKMYNTATGFATGNTSLIPCAIFVPANSVIQAVVTDAAATNPINLVIVTS